MRKRANMWTLSKKISYVLYSIFAKWLPKSSHSTFAKKMRRFFAKRVTKRMGTDVNIERGAVFSPDTEIGDHSGIGIRAEVYGPVAIGNAVMMGPEVIIYTRNHKHEAGLPFYKQGFDISSPVSIGNNVWIGRRAMFMPGSSVGSNVVVAAGAVVTKNFGDNIIIGGVPAKIIGKIGTEGL